MTTIVLLVLAALVLIFFEVLLPGGILGVLAAICVLAASWVGVEEFGAIGGGIVFIAAVAACLVLTVIEFKLFARTKFGESFFLRDSVTGHTRGTEEADSLVGKRGKTLTRLNPIGTIAVDGQSYEAFCQDGYVGPGEEVEIVSRDNFKLNIKKP